MNDERFLGLTKEQFGLGLLAANVALILVAVVMFTLALTASRARNAEVAAIAAESRSSWCAVKQNTQRQIESTSNYLATHPSREPIPGINRAALYDSLKRLRTFRDAIKVDGCLLDEHR